MKAKKEIEKKHNEWYSSTYNNKAIKPFRGIRPHPIPTIIPIACLAQYITSRNSSYNARRSGKAKNEKTKRLKLYLPYLAIPNSP